MHAPNFLAQFVILKLNLAHALAGASAEIEDSNHFERLQLPKIPLTEIADVD